MSSLHGTKNGCPLLGVNVMFSFYSYKILLIKNYFKSFFLVKTIASVMTAELANQLVGFLMKRKRRLSVPCASTIQFSHQLQNLNSLGVAYLYRNLTPLWSNIHRHYGKHLHLLRLQLQVILFRTCFVQFFHLCRE